MLDIDRLGEEIVRRHGRPLVGLKWAQTLDGQLADDGGRSKWISGAEELSYTHRLRARYDAILVGASTFLADLSKLTVRLPDDDPARVQPIRVVLDPRDRVSAEDPRVRAALEDGAARPTVLLSLRDGDERIAANAFRLGVASSFGRDLGLRRLADFSRGVFLRDVNKVMVEGGPTTLRIFLEKGLADVACVGIAPILTGGTANRIQLMSSLHDGHRLRHFASRAEGQDTVIEMISKELA